MTPTITIARQPANVADQPFDVVIAGGGIYGALSAVEAASRGLRTLLLERSDFGAATSFNSLRTIHGGLRYLQRLDLARARSSSRQRDWWLRHFPDLVVPISCLMPLYGRGVRRRTAFRAAFAITRLLGLNGAQDLPAGQRLKPPMLLTGDEVCALAPAVPAAGLEGGALWSDAFMADSSRIIIETVRWAVGAGARALNYAELTHAEPDRAGRSRLSILDRTSGDELTVTTRTVINATGPAVDELARRLGSAGQPLLVPTIAWNLLLDADAPSACSLALTPPRPGAPTYFVHPFHGRVLAGTGHAALLPGTDGSAADARPSAELVEAMRADLGDAILDAGLGDAPVLRVLAGVLPGVRPASSRLALRPRIVRGAAAGGAALWNIVGVKFTEAPEIARRVLMMAGGGERRPLPLPPRPAAAGNWNVLRDTQAVTRSALLELAASESAVYLDDLIERRTNAWCEDGARERVEALVGGDFGRDAA